VPGQREEWPENAERATNEGAGTKIVRIGKNKVSGSGVYLFLIATEAFPAGWADESNGGYGYGYGHEYIDLIDRSLVPYSPGRMDVYPDIDQNGPFQRGGRW